MSLTELLVRIENALIPLPRSSPLSLRYLPENSNLVQFQRRFRLLPEREPEVSDADILAFVFNRAYDSAEVPLSLLATLPQETALQRAFVSHLRAGKHWYARAGWLEF